MYVYELAIQIGKRSADVIDAADQLGLGSISAASNLSPEQHARLYAHFTGQQLAGPPPPAFGAPTGGAPSPFAGASGPAPTPVEPKTVKPAVAVGLAIAALVVLCAGAFAFLGKSDQRLADKVAAEKADEEREDAADMAAHDAKADVDARDDVNRCAAIQKLAEIDGEVDNLIQYGSINFAQWRFAVDRLLDRRQEMMDAFAELRPLVAADQQAILDQMRDMNVEALDLMASATSIELVEPVAAQASAWIERYDAVSSNLDVDDGCTIS